MSPLRTNSSSSLFSSSSDFLYSAVVVPHSCSTATAEPWNNAKRNGTKSVPNFHSNKSDKLALISWNESFPNVGKIKSDTLTVIHVPCGTPACSTEQAMRQ